MASFDTDHNVALRVSRLLITRGHHATTARELGLERAGDEEPRLIAPRCEAILVTHNEKDVLLLHDAWRRWSHRARNLLAA